MLDFFIVLVYFAIIMIAALSGRQKMRDMSSEEYFLSSRNLKWYSIAISTIATNVQGYQFLGMMGSAYLYGLAQANLEINAVTGLWMAAFIFVPLYLKERVITVTQFIKKRLGEWVALAYSIGNLFLFATVALGAALFWGAYAADLIFSDILSFISENRMIRIGTIAVLLGVFSAIYTYFGGLSAVVRTDIIQFSILLIGGIVVLFAAINHLGGWDQLYKKTPDLMHLHLPADHKQLPWTLMFGLFLLNINYWCANQSVIQRSLAARSLKDAQVGLMVGGVMKYFMAVIIIVPGIALAGILGDNPLKEADQTFPYLVTNYLPTGVLGLIVCALFASLMSTVDSLFNSMATLWSVDIYKPYINKEATDKELVSAGRKTILVTLVTGILMSFVLIYAKFQNPEEAFTHNLNSLRYYIITGIVVVICSAAFLVKPERRLALAAVLSAIPLNLLIQYFFPDMNYFVRAGWVIGIAFSIVAVPSIVKNGLRPIREYVEFSSSRVANFGWVLLLSMVLLHVLLS